MTLCMAPVRDGPIDTALGELLLEAANRVDTTDVAFGCGDLEVDLAVKRDLDVEVTATVGRRCLTVDAKRRVARAFLEGKVEAEVFKHVHDGLANLLAPEVLTVSGCSCGRRALELVPRRVGSGDSFVK